MFMNAESKKSRRNSVNNAQHSRKRRREELEDMNSGSSTVAKMSGDVQQKNSDEDLFADCSLIEEDGLSEVIVKNAENDLEDNIARKQSENETGCAWLGASLDEIRNGRSPSLPPVAPSHNHTVFYEWPISSCGGPPKPHPQRVRDCWDSDHVRMPYSEHNLYPVQEGDDQNNLRQRWELMQEALLKTMMSSQELEAAILSYNSKYSERWDFSLLHLLFAEVFSEDETNNFFSSLLPKIVQLALQLPALITAPIPLLVQHRNHTLSFSQLQIASLLANAFLCTFPRRNTSKRQSEYAHYPDINFNRLYQGNDNRLLLKCEKLKCLLHYFRRVCTKAPEGVVTYSRRYVHHRNLPLWDRSSKLLTKFYISSEGNIEDDGGGMLQVDFANRLVGGGVLGRGGVQEEIRFIICPELIVARLFTEALDSTEALLIVGCERFSMYKGYSDSFEWTGDCRDKTPHDNSRRLNCSIIAVDAMRLGNRNVQYSPSNLMRELNKAYAGFHCPEFTSDEKLAGVATGNWGCGAFRGDARLKSLLQLMAASQAGRSLAYFTFGDTQLRDDIFHMYTYLVDQQVTISQLWRFLCQYYDSCFRKGKLITELYPFLYQALSKKKKSPSVFGLLTGHCFSRSSTQDRSKAEGGEWLSSTNKGRPSEENKMQSKDRNPKEKNTTVTSMDTEVSIADTFMNDELDVSVRDNDIEELNELEESQKKDSNENKGVDEKKASLLDYLDHYERSSLSRPLVTNPSPTPKKKISDYFTSVPRTK